MLLSVVAVESTIIANRRVKPMDHLFGLMTAKHLLANQTVPDEMMLRPWLIPALSLPTETVGGRFGYWIYLGQMAWINVVGLAMMASVAQRWKLPRNFTAAMLGLSPLTTAFHFPGQRVLVAALCLLAIDEWTSRNRVNWTWWGGWAAAAAVLAHPGALFILPTAALYFVFRRRWRIAILGLTSVGIALGTYLLWTTFAANLRPEVRNNLAHYPFMRALDDQPVGGNLREIVAGLSSEHWKELALNRVKQFRHYVWADNPWQTALYERLRAVSLISTLGVVLTLCALVQLTRFENRGVLWIGVFGPLVLFHLHIGQAFPQFHILPTPFFALALVGLSATPRLGKTATRLIVAESLLHLLFVPALVLGGLAGEFELPGWFAGDPRSKFLSVVPMVPWMVLAASALRSEKDPDD